MIDIFEASPGEAPSPPPYHSKYPSNEIVEELDEREKGWNMK